MCIVILQQNITATGKPEEMESTNNPSKHNNVITCLADDLMVLVWTVDSLDEQLSSSKLSNVSVANSASNELDSISEQSKKIGIQLQQYSIEHPQCHSVIQVQKSLEDICYKVQNTRRALRQATVQSIVRSEYSRPYQIRSDISMYDLRLSLQELQHNLRNIALSP